MENKRPESSLTDGTNPEYKNSRKYLDIKITKT